MYIQQLYTNCLSQASYYIESNGVAAVIDPIRDIEDYINLAKERNSTIKYVFESHFHADFVSGHLDLANATNSTIVYGPNTQTNFKVHVAKDEEVFNVGNITLTALHTPGHTLESTCYLLKNEEGKTHAIFTGDTLFIGDVGRPDLAQKGETLTTQDLAGMMYDSLQNKIMPLADDVILYPAHGAGSSCGKSLSKETVSTIGEQKKTNYALNQATKEDFIKAVTDGLTEPPSYFPINAQINKQGYDSIDEVVNKGLTPLTIQQVKSLYKEDDIIILDTRPANVFTEGFVPNSIFIGLEGRFAEWAGSLLPFNKNLVIVAEAGKEKESIVRLARVGFSQFAGTLQGGFEAWQQAGERIDMIINIEADELAMDINFDEKLVIVDVRKETEFGDEHLKEAINIPLNELTDVGTMADFEETDNIYVHCAGGYRSVIAASLIKKQGIHNIRNIEGGWSKIKELTDKFTFEKTKAVLN
jgi:hydroxyacylglutathione hydrolase